MCRAPRDDELSDVLEYGLARDDEEASFVYGRDGTVATMVQAPTSRLHRPDEPVFTRALFEV